MRPISFLFCYLGNLGQELAIDLRLAKPDADVGGTVVAAAFETYDRARAWSLFEQVVRRRRLDSDREVRNPTIQQLQARLNHLAESREFLRAKDSTPAQRRKLDVELRQTALELEDARADIRARARTAGRLGSPRAVSTDELVAHLPDGSMVLAYRLGATASHLFTVSHRGVESWVLAPRTILEAHAEALYRSLEASQTDPVQWRLIAETFAEKLLPRQAVPADIDRLFVMADGLLHYVPFAVLASPRRNFAIDPSGHLLIDDFEVTYIPSASVFVALDSRRQTRPAPEKLVAAFVDPVFHHADERWTGQLRFPPPSFVTRSIPAQRLPDGPLPRLPHTADEAGILTRLVPESARRIWSGFEASKQAMLNTSLDRYRILHLATHAFIDEDVPELSGLVFSRFDAVGRPVDGKLYLHEIQDLDLAADLTVLSGCQTALGQHVEGNGLLGLNHGFFEAGSARVLVTLWSVDDHAASLLMAAFYKRLLRDGHGPASALRHAQQVLRQHPEYSAPYYWAQFTLHGAP